MLNVPISRQMTVVMIVLFILFKKFTWFKYAQFFVSYGSISKCMDEFSVFRYKKSHYYDNSIKITFALNFNII